MPPAVVEEVCTITAKGQTTVPKAVRQALGVGYGGRIAFRVERGRVTVHALPERGEAADPALAPFLALLEADLAARPAEAVRPLPEALAGRLDALAAEVGPVDPDEPIEGEVSL
ncbi:type II toxin-antitoxin system PrlF family antitoxin [Roseicella sp. DB1501]|uniref:type II toxin-antitoxin system PrlF family antitoxin n=1 Tax=Roseicella sp. DB1501 TaxID=2730925 RepID=UPI001492069F|nr:type II toxin-antitoxin system PrlF family antitoxin [Roseicella sp. DB1501]NOG74163.1 AbrB family transcriptional regulator [Roseicella sp. DB1501]